MWTQMNGAGPGVQSWIDEEDRERIELTEQFLRKVRSHLQSVRDNPKLRGSAIRKAARLAIRNETLRDHVERDIFTSRPGLFTCSPDRFIDHIEMTLDYAIWDPEEYLWACSGRPWPETKYVC